MRRAVIGDNRGGLNVGNGVERAIPIALNDGKVPGFREGVRIGRSARFRDDDNRALRSRDA